METKRRKSASKSPVMAPVKKVRKARAAKVMVKPTMMKSITSSLSVKLGQFRGFAKRMMSQSFMASNKNS